MLIVHSTNTSYYTLFLLLFFLVCGLLPICVYIFTVKVCNGFMGGDYKAFTTLPKVYKSEIDLERNIFCLPRNFDHGLPFSGVRKIMQNVQRDI